MTTKNFFNEIERRQINQFADCMQAYKADKVELKKNQRIKTDKLGFTWLQEKQSFKTCDGRRHNCWVDIAVIK